jgi:hypothetical protein
MTAGGKGLRLGGGGGITGSRVSGESGELDGFFGVFMVENVLLYKYISINILRMDIHADLSMNYLARI